MHKKLPEFEFLVPHYPTLGTVDEIKAQIGGDVNQAHYKNSCIMRVSQALNYSGQPIPFDTAKFGTKRGADKKWYGLRVGEFWDYMLKTYGKPEIYSPKGKRLNFGDYKGRRGIIGFRAQFSDATGHFTLFDGFRLLYGGDHFDYFGESYEAAMWLAGNSFVSEAEV